MLSGSALYSIAAVIMTLVLYLTCVAVDNDGTSRCWTGSLPILIGPSTTESPTGENPDETETPGTKKGTDAL
jgi:hypothetical protein